MNLKKKRGQELIAGIVITSPTYDGIVSDVKGIAELAHSYGLPLVVDQAHGAHLGMHPDFPANAVSEGADLVIHSVHKTLPAPTQTALLHRNGELTDREILKRYLRIYQSSSPSYLLMTGIDEAVSLAEKEGNSRLDRLLLWRNSFLQEMRKCTFLRVCPLTEPGKLVIAVKGFPMTGQRLYDILRDRYHLQMEMAAGSYVVAILTMMDQEEGLQRLLRALQEIDIELLQTCESTFRPMCIIQESCKYTPKVPQREQNGGGTIECNYSEKDFSEKGIFSPEYWKTDLWKIDLRPHAILNLWEAYRMPFEEIALEEAEGRTAAEFINLYPPGIPLLVPGERIERRLTELVLDYLVQGYRVQGICNYKIKVIKPLNN